MNLGELALYWYLIGVGLTKLDDEIIALAAIARLSEFNWPAVFRKAAPLGDQQRRTDIEPQ